MTDRTRPAGRATALAAAALLLAGLAACAPAAPGDEVSDLRAGYQARLNTFNVRQTPLAAEPATVAAPAEGEAAEPAAPEPAAEPPAADVPLRQDVYLDILITHDGGERLPGLTLDVTQVDAAEQPKASYRIWVDTATMPVGTSSAVTHVLEDVSYAENDGFSVEVRAEVPPEDRADYREYADLAGEAP